MIFNLSNFANFLHAFSFLFLAMDRYDVISVDGWKKDYIS